MTQEPSSPRTLARTVERLGPNLWSVVRELEAVGRPSPLLLACCESLQHLPTRTAPSTLLSPTDCERGLAWSRGVAAYGLWLARLSAGDMALRGEVPSYVPPDPDFATDKSARPRRHLVVPLPTAWADATDPEDTADPEGALRAMPGLVAVLPALEFRELDQPAARPPDAVARFGLMALESVWLGAATGRDVQRLTAWIADLFARYWAWSRSPDAAAQEVEAAAVLALAHRITTESADLMLRPPVALPRYPVHLRTGAARFLHLPPDATSSRLREVLDELASALTTAHGLRAVAVVEASGDAVDHRVAFWDELPAPPDDPAVFRIEDGKATRLRRGTTHAAFDRPPEILEKVDALRQGKQLRGFASSAAWFEAVRRSVECDLVQKLQEMQPSEVMRVRGELAGAFSELALELWNAKEHEKLHAIASFMEHHFGMALVPSLPTTPDAPVRLRRGDQAAIDGVDWERSRALNAPQVTRGTISLVETFGVREATGPLRLAVVELSLGPPTPMPQLGRGLANRVEALDWLTLDAESIDEQTERVVKEATRCSPEYFQDRIRERDLLLEWLEQIETDVADDPRRAMEAMRDHGALLRRAAEVGAELSPFLTVTRLGNVTLDPEVVSVRYEYQEATAPLDVLGILSTGLLDPATRPEIIVSRGAQAPTWLEGLRRAAQAAPGAIVDLAAEFYRAHHFDPHFEGREWRTQFLGRLLRACTGAGGEAHRCLIEIQQTLASAQDLQSFRLLPAVKADGTPEPVDSLDDLPQDEDGVTHWFTDDLPRGTVVDVERPGLYEAVDGATGRWHVPPQITISAGTHTAFTRLAQPLLRRVLEWLGVGPFADGKRNRLTRLFRSGALPLFHGLAKEESASGDETRGIQRLLCSRGGVATFLAQAGCRDAGLLQAVESLALDAGLAVDLLEGPSWAPSSGPDTEPVPVLLPDPGDNDAPRLYKAHLTTHIGTVSGVAVEMIQCLGTRDGVDTDLRETRAIADTLIALVDKSVSIQSTAIFLATKAYSLLPADRKAGGSAGRRDVERLHGGVEAALELQGLTLLPIEIGDDVRRFEGRYKPRPGAVNWRVTHVERPCLMKGDQVLQLGIVETD